MVLAALSDVLGHVGSDLGDGALFDASLRGLATPNETQAIVLTNDGAPNLCAEFPALDFYVLM